ncbi:MAG: phosphatidate cytidylyltransferase [Bacteroidales bacterium]|jgi:phosphatidate cytidylyltransferase|nr:phosphatidate cytidylyltransferase [Bacteroidales bacterium]
MKNLLIRTVSGIFIMIIVMGSIIWGPVSYIITLCAITAIMMHEYLTLSLGRKKCIQKILAVAGGVFFIIIMFFIKYTGTDSEFLYLTIIPLLAIMAINLYHKPYNIYDTEKERKSNRYELTAFYLSSFVYIAIPVSFFTILPFLRNGSYDSSLMISLLILLWSTDIGAYCFGMLFGQKHGHKLFPSISPKKTWEGVYGGFFCVICASTVLYFSGYLGLSFMNSLILALITGTFSIFGDLVESQLKRNFGAKDSSKLIPGHGGMLDRFDGALFAFPAACLYMQFFCFE